MFGTVDFYAFSKEVMNCWKNEIIILSASNVFSIPFKTYTTSLYFIPQILQFLAKTYHIYIASQRARIDSYVKI